MRLIRLLSAAIWLALAGLCELPVSVAQSQVLTKFHVTVTVIDASGAPIPKANLKLSTVSSLIATAATGPEGTASLDLPAGSYQLFATCIGFAPTKQTVTVNDSGKRFFIVPLQIGMGGGPVVADNPVNHLELWAPPLDDILIERVEISHMFGHRRIKQIDSLSTVP